MSTLQWSNRGLRWVVNEPIRICWPNISSRCWSVYRTSHPPSADRSSSKFLSGNLPHLCCSTYCPTLSEISVSHLRRNIWVSPVHAAPFSHSVSWCIQLQPRTFDASWIAYVITRLSDRTKMQATAVWEVNSPCCQTFGLLAEEMKRVFDQFKHGRQAARELLQSHRGHRFQLRRRLPDRGDLQRLEGAGPVMIEWK